MRELLAERPQLVVDQRRDADRLAQLVGRREQEALERRGAARRAVAARVEQARVARGGQVAAADLLRAQQRVDLGPGLALDDRQVVTFAAGGAVVRIFSTSP